MTKYRLFATSLLVCLACITLVTESHATSPTITNLSPNFGAVGSTITVYGTNFGTTFTSHSIKFNGVTATASLWTSSKITVTVPSTTTGTITVTTTGGTGTSSVEFTVLPTNGALAMGVAPQATNCPALGGSYNCITDYQSDVMPNTDGIVIVVPWDKIETSQSTYVWTQLDTWVNNYVGQTGWDATKKIGIVLAPVTSPTTGSQVNLATPGYVFTTTYATSLGASPQDECTCSSWGGDGSVPTSNGCWNANTSGDTSGFPAVWETPFQTALKAFYSNAVTYLNSTATYSSYISYVRMGLAAGGEEYPFCYANLAGLAPGGDLKTAWLGNANTMFTYEAGLGSELPLMASPNGGQNATIDYTWADSEASDAYTEGLNLGNQGFQDNDLFATGHDCSNDWCYTYTTYPTPIMELQTLTASEPADIGGGLTPCASNYSPDTGSLVCLLPFAEGKVNVVELLNADMFTAYDSNDANYGTYGTAYATAISNLRTGH